MSDQYVPDQLRTKAELYAIRNTLYKDNYKRFGAAMVEMLGAIELKTPADYNRMGLLVQIVNKVSRYAQMFKEGGHDDSLDDLSVYAMMLKEIDNDIKSERII